MNTRVIATLIIGLVLAPALACGSPISATGPPAQPPTAEILPDCETKTSGFRDDCYLQAALERNDIDLCAKNVKAMHPDYCYIMFAQEKGDETYCESEHIELETNRDSCWGSVAIARAEESLCRKASSGQGMCIAGVAVKKLQPALCEQAERERDMCYFEIARLTGDASLCEKLEFGKEMCQSEVK